MGKKSARILENLQPPEQDPFEFSVEKVKSYIADYRLHASECLFVRNHNTAQIEPLIFRPGQNVMHDVAEKRKEETGYLRVLLLKNRRYGGSTYIGGRGYNRSSLNPNQSIFIIGHETDSTNTLYRMVQLFHELNPIAPPTKKSNAQELIFDAERKGEYGLKSEYKLATAKNLEAGRSQGIHFLHDSEEAMWPSHAEELLTSLFSCVPRPPADTEIWRESTGKGYGNTFQKAVFDTWAEGKYPYFKTLISTYAPHMPNADVEFIFAYHNPRSHSDWILIFIPWFLDPSCQREFRNDEEKKEFVRRIENAKGKPDNINYDALTLQKKYKLTLEQLFWREWSIVNECNSNVSLFKQENPLTVIEAFRTKGSNHYSAEFCDMVEKDCISPVVVGNIIHRMGVPKIEPSPTGYLSIFERFDPRETYFLTVDAAGGKKEVHVKEDREPDCTVIDVWGRRTGNHASQWYGHIDYDMIDEMVEAVGSMYGRAIACVELNNHGYAVVKGLKKKDYPMYYNKPGEPGWLTNKRTKHIMADDLLSGCRDGTITIRCIETVNEMRTYVEVSGKFGAEAGCKDDRVTSAQMAVQMMELLPAHKRSDDNDTEDFNDLRGVESAWMAS